jgi:hypothetical protein
MTTTIKKRVHYHTARGFSRNLPHNVTKQLRGIYQQSVKNIKKHPYTTSSGIFLSLGIASSIYFLIRYFKTK